MTVEEKLIVNSLEEPAWFAMSATFGRELKAKTFLESKSVKCFIPMKYQIVNDKKQGKIKKLAPAINNLIFVYTTKERIQALKSVAEYADKRIAATKEVIQNKKENSTETINNNSTSNDENYNKKGI